MEEIIVDARDSTPHGHVIRCQDCGKWCGPEIERDGHEFGQCTEFSRSGVTNYTRECGYCYWAEPKGEHMGETNYDRLFGTPERAAELINFVSDMCDGRCSDCPLSHACLDDNGNALADTHEIADRLREETDDVEW